MITLMIPSLAAFVAILLIWLSQINPWEGHTISQVLMDIGFVVLIIFLLNFGLSHLFINLGGLQ
jgi:hypothetical protein